ncbi:MAG: adenylyl-sulfate kinase [Pseudonocardiaceae bacterium]
MIWLTGLPGAGKSTLAQRLRKELAALRRSPEVLDEDERTGYLARLIARAGGVAIAAAISPSRQAREELRDGGQDRARAGAAALPPPGSGETGRLAGGAPFTLPIQLRVEADAAPAVNSAEWLGLRQQGQLGGPLKPTGALRTDTEAEALARSPSAFPAYDLTPSDVRAAATKRGWRTIVGFQTRNPAHRTHEHPHQVRLSRVDGLLHPLAREAGDVPCGVMKRSWPTTSTTPGEIQAARSHVNGVRARRTSQRG